MPHRLRELFVRQPGHWIGLMFFVVVASLTTWLHAQVLPKAPGAEVFSLTPTPGYFTEPSIAINPNNPQQVVAVFQDNAHASYSEDAGHTWFAAQGVAPANYRVSGDVSAAFDNQGHAFICYMAFDKLGTFNYWGHNASRSGLFVRRSLDGGKTWDTKLVPIIEHASEPGIPFEDKPYIVADTTKSRYAGNLYVGWTRWTLTDSEILLSRSTDDGQTWSKPTEIDRHPGLPRDDNGAAEGFDGTVGPDGTLYAVWSQDDDIFLTTSRDGGRTFSRARAIVHTAPIMFAVETLERANGFPQIAMDPRSRRLYLTWSDYRNGDLDVFCATSTDGGKKWSAPVRVNNDSVHNGADQFFQWLAVDPKDGAANVIFYDRRGDPQNRKQIVVLARSTDGGHSFQNYAWTSEPFEAGGVFFGDYSGIAAYDGRVYGVWTEKPVTVPETGNTGDEAKPKPRGTVVKVGVADFKTASAGTAQ
ncbi:MAG: exo-alpha-sialidase [Candidatus Sulfotelmatobacter sp.]